MKGRERPKTVVPYLKVEKGDAGSHQAAHSDIHSAVSFFLHSIYLSFIRPVFNTVL
jgi:hypothetical protein